MLGVRIIACAFFSIFLVGCSNSKPRFFSFPGLDDPLKEDLKTSPHSIDERGYSSLHRAILLRDFELASSLIQQGADVNLKSSLYANTPLHLVFERSLQPFGSAKWFSPEKEKKIEQFVRLLVKNGSNVHAVNVWGRTPLHFASEAGFVEVGSFLLEQGVQADFKKNGFTPLYDLLLQHPSDCFKEKALCRILLENKIKFAKRLIAQGANVNDTMEKTGNSLLHLASFKAPLELVKMLVEEGAHVNAINHKKQTPLHLAALRGDKNVVSFLIKNGVELDVQDHQGSTAIHLASQKCHSEVVLVLADHMANLNLRDKKGNTPLHFQMVRYWPDTRVILDLIRRGADVNAVNEMGRTPLHQIVIWEGYMEPFIAILGFILDGMSLPEENGARNVAEILIENGADIYSKDNNGNTALHLLSRNWLGGIFLGNFLINQGLSKDEENAFGETPFQLAFGKENRKSLAPIIVFTLLSLIPFIWVPIWLIERKKN